MSPKQAQLADVAMTAKVARSTAAAALRPGAGGKNARVSKATAERIRRIARELGYRPNRLAAGLRGASTSSVAAVWQFVDPWCLDSSVGNELLNRFQNDGLATYQAAHPNKPAALISVLDDLLERCPDALVIRWRPDTMEHAGVREMLRQFKAVLAVVPWPAEGMEIDQVVHDRDSGIVDVARHFASTGRKRPAIVVNTRDVTDRRKYDVFRRTLAEHGVEWDRDLIDLGTVHSSDGDRVLHYTRALENHFADSIDADAIFHVNDVGVMTAAKFLRERGVAIGDEVALVGLNDPVPLRLWDPPLASVDRNQPRLTEIIHEMVTRRMKEPDLPPQLETVSMHMVWRESAGRPPTSQ